VAAAGRGGARIAALTLGALVLALFFSDPGRFALGWGAPDAN
jgi:hypothetical protein